MSINVEYSKYEYGTLASAKHYLSKIFQTFQEESKVTDDDSILFFTTFKNADFLINNENYSDLCKLSHFFQVQRLIKILDDFKNNHNFDIDFVINEILKQIQNNTSNYCTDDKFSFDMETNLYGKVNECLQNERFHLLPISVVYRILSKSTEEISGDLLFDFISKSIDSRFPLFSFLNYNSLSDEKLSELIDLHGQNQHYFQYLPPNLMYLKSIKDENKVIKNQLDELNKKCHKYNEFFDDAFKFAELMVLLDSCSLEGEVIRFLELCSERGNVLAHMLITYLALLSGGEEGKKLAFPYLQKLYEEGNKYALCIFGLIYDLNIFEKGKKN